MPDPPRVPADPSPTTARSGGRQSSPATLDATSTMTNTTNPTRRAGAVVLALFGVVAVAAVGGPAVTSQLASGAEGQTYLVDDDGSQCDTDMEHISTALAAAGSGDTVTVCEGTYSERLTIDTANLHLDARGDAVIESSAGTVVRITAADVTLTDFEVRAAGPAEVAVAVGARDVHIEDNLVVSNGTGILLSDGRTPLHGQPDPAMEPAEGSMVVHNTIRAESYRVWADADGAVVAENVLADRPASGDGTGEEWSETAVLLTGNDTVVRNNDVRYDAGRYTKYDNQGIEREPGIQVGMAGDRNSHRNFPSGPPPDAHNVSRTARVAGNELSGCSGAAVWLREGATGTVVADNTFSSCGHGIVSYANDTVIRGNLVTGMGSENGVGDGIAVVGYGVLVEDNTLRRNSNGVTIGGFARVVDNTIENNANQGVYISYDCSHCNWGKNGEGYILNNRLVNNVGSGVAMAEEPVNHADVIEIHRNVIAENGRLGVHLINQNYTGPDGPIVDARWNFWACGGPSSGLEDPVTGRLANGTGDEISASNTPGVSNVRFDPFYERAACPTSGATPTPTPTRTPEPTPSPTPTTAIGSTPTSGSPTATPTPAPTATATATTETGSGDGSGNATGPGDGDSDTGDGPGTDDGSGDGSETVTPSRTPTESPSPTPTETVSPTPVVQPGFGVATWIAGIVALVGLLAVRRRG